MSKEHKAAGEKDDSKEQEMLKVTILLEFMLIHLNSSSKIKINLSLKKTK
jgi:hypothetical protein